VVSPILQPCSSAPPGLCYPKFPPLRLTQSLPDEPFRPAQAWRISTLPVHTLQACQASDPETFMISTGPHPQACTGLNDLHWAAPLTPSQACTISTGNVPLKPAKLAIHKHAGSPLCWPMPIRHTRPMLQRPASSLQWKASSHRHVGPHPPATCYKRAPNLPKRHTRTGLDAKRVTSEHLRLQFYCSRTGDFFFFFLFSPLL
jgi:hypothetical protein